MHVLLLICSHIHSTLLYYFCPTIDDVSYISIIASSSLNWWKLCTTTAASHWLAYGWVQSAPLFLPVREAIVR